MLNTLRSPNLVEFLKKKKKSGPIEQNKPRFKKKAPIQDEPRDPKIKLEQGSRSQDSKPTCVNCRKKHCKKCLVGNGNCFVCGKDGYKVKDCPTITIRGKEGKQVPPSVLGDDVPKNNLLDAIRAKVSKSDKDDVGKI